MHRAVTRRTAACGGGVTAGDDLREHETAVLASLAGAPALACFLDYDGTLAAIAPTPEDARPWPGTTELLGCLVRAPATEVTIVSGRTIADLRRQLDVPGLGYIGIHGLEWARPGSSTIARAEAAIAGAALLPDVRRELAQRVGGLPGVRLEDKGVAVACHYRLARRNDARRAREAVEALVEQHRQRGATLTALHGHEVSEIRPAGVDKGRTVLALLAGRTPPPLVLYMGDDRTDEDAFRVLPADAVTVRIGPSDIDTLARYRLPGPLEVHAFLTRLVEVRR